jgi:hypothetical protein
LAKSETKRRIPFNGWLVKAIPNSTLALKRAFSSRRLVVTLQFSSSTVRRLNFALSVSVANEAFLVALVRSRSSVVWSPA